MEKINKHNYEAFWLDYLEGNLDKSSIDSMFAFFDQHPELKPDLNKDDLFTVPVTDETPFNTSSLLHRDEEVEEKIVFLLDNELDKDEAVNMYSLMSKNMQARKIFDDYSKIRLESDKNISLPNVISLKKSPLSDELLIGYTEGILSAEDFNTVRDTMAEDAVTAHHINLFKAGKLISDTSIVYPHKAALKQKEAKVIWLNRYFIPAYIAAAILLFFTIRNFNKIDEPVKIAPLANNSAKLDHPNPLTTHRMAESLLAKAAKNSMINSTEHTVKQLGNKLPDENKITSNENPLVKKDSSSNSTLEQPEWSSEEYAYDKIAINVYNDPEALNKNTSAKKTTNLITEKINETVWGEDPGNVAQTESTKKLKGFDLVGMLSKTFKKLGGKRSDAKKIENAVENSTEYVVTLGGLSLKKTVHN